MPAPVRGRTLTIHTKEVTYMLARRQKSDGSGTTAIRQSVIVILVSICGGDIVEVTHTPHVCKMKSTNVPGCTQCTMEVTRYTARAIFKSESNSELLVTQCHLVLIYKGGNTKISTFLPIRKT